MSEQQQNGTALTLRAELTKMTGQFEQALPRVGITAERFTRVVTTAIMKDANLMNADRKSLFGACMSAAQDGLLPDGREAALVTFYDKHIQANRVQYMPMMAGILKKVRNSGELATFTSNIVFEADPFEYYVDDTGEHLKHTPNVLATDRGKPIGAYALAKTKDGGIYVEVMSVAQIEQVRAASRAKDSGPWKTWWDEMARKTVSRRLCKRLPMSTDLDSLIRADDPLYDLDGRDAPETTAAAAAREAKGDGRPSRLRAVSDAPAQPEHDAIEGQFVETPLDEVQEPGPSEPEI